MSAVARVTASIDSIGDGVPSVLLSPRVPTAGHGDTLAGMTRVAMLAPMTHELEPIVRLLDLESAACREARCSVGVPISG